MSHNPMTSSQAAASWAAYERASNPLLHMYKTRATDSTDKLTKECEAHAQTKEKLAQAEVTRMRHELISKLYPEHVGLPPADILKFFKTVRGLEDELSETKHKLLQWESACIANREDFKGVLHDKDTEILALRDKLAKAEYVFQVLRDWYGQADPAPIEAIARSVVQQALQKQRTSRRLS